ncbi:MAG TPA: 16S rRNA (guanine(966)-N(2))-methyltransferase RsmD [Planctomycetaceae bacterium]|nr:16S rRNA (guanine(966)-N(2))-methyltransferase RsmD [Planctomycetaceae bacterium]
MRIIAGKFRRRKLRTRPGLVTRPITDRVKESLFELLGEELEGRRVADVFAGTGTLGLEALSRGAAAVVFIESDRRAHELLRENVALLGAERETLCWQTDVLRTSFRPKGVPHLIPYEIVFFDPPFRMIADLRVGSALYRALERLARPDVTSPEALLLVRTPAGAAFDVPGAWRRERMLESSGMDVHWLRKGAAAD